MALGSSDGHITIDTKVDQSGLKKGLAAMSSNIVKGISAAVAAGGAALAGLGKYAISVGSDFEAANSNLAATMGTTTDKITALTERAKELGASTSFSATQAAEGLNILAQAGLSADEQLQAIDNTLSLAAAGEMAMDAAAGYLTTTVKAFSVSNREANISMEDTARIADIYAKGATMANTSTAAFAEAMQTSASLAGTFNQSIDSTGVALLALADKGYQGSQAGNYLARAMQDLYTPTDNAKKAIDALGIKMYDAKGNQRDFIDIVNDMNKAMKGMTEEQKATYTSAIFSSVGLKAFNSIAGTSKDRLNELADGLAGSWYSLDSLKESLDKSGMSFVSMQKNMVELGVTSDEFNKALDYSKGDVETFAKMLVQSSDKGVQYDDVVKALGGDMTKLGKAFEETKGSAEAMADTKLDNLKGDITILQSATEGFGISVYENMQEPLRSLVQEGTGLMDELNKSVKEGGLEGLAEGVGSVLAKAVSIISGYIPKLVELSTSIVRSFLNGLETAAPDIINAGVTAAVSFLEGLEDIIPRLFFLGTELIYELMEGLNNSFPQILSSFTENLDFLLESVVDNPHLFNTGIKMISQMAEAIVKELPNILKIITTEINYQLTSQIPWIIETLINFIPSIINSISQAIITTIPILLNAVSETILSIIEQLPDLLSSIIDVLSEVLTNIVDAVKEFLPTFIEMLPEIINEILTALVELLPQLVEVYIEYMQMVVESIGELLPLIIEVVMELVNSLLEMLPEIINQIVVQLPALIHGIVEALLSMLPMLVDCGVQLFTSLIRALPQIIYAIVSVLPVIINSVISTLISLIPLLIKCGIELLTSLVKALPTIIITIVAVLPQIISSIIRALLDNMPLLIQCGVDLLTSLISDLPSIINAILLRIPEIIAAIIQALIDNIPQLVECGIKLLTSLVKDIPKIIITIVKAIPQIIKAIVNAFKNGFSSIKKVGVDLLKGLWSGISDTVSWLLNKLKGVCNSALGAIKNFFGIHSPSTVMRDFIGKNLMLGWSVGIDQNGKEVTSSFAEVAKDILDIPVSYNVDNLNTLVPDRIQATASISYLEDMVSQERRKSADVSRSESQSYSISGGSENDKDKDEPKPKMVVAHFSIDGKEFARAEAPYIEEEITWRNK